MGIGRRSSRSRGRSTGSGEFTPEKVGPTGPWRKWMCLASVIEARANLASVAARLGLPIEELRGIPYVWRQRRSETEFPTREEFWTIAPALVEAKARGGLAWFNTKWSDNQSSLRMRRCLSQFV